MADSTLGCYRPVIGLEIHVQLKTETKMFCASSALYGAEPNTSVCPVCLGLPGALPVINALAVELGVRAALGLHCTVHPHSTFARKSYFYPDLPKGYQITQYDQPLATDGFLSARLGEHDEPVRVRIRSVHLEEDAGKSIHDRFPGATAVDFNRAGVPLIEIVTEPDLVSPAHARSFLTRLRQLLEYLEVSDCNMEEGSLRVDANVSLRRVGDTGLGTRTEVKNLNSFSGIERALQFEIDRQKLLLRGGAVVTQQTLLWDAGRGEARPLRAKEESRDYRYFTEPDLPPLELSEPWIDRVREALPEMPWSRVERFRRFYGLSYSHAEVLTGTRELADYFEAIAVAEGVDPQEAANWVLGDVLAAVKADACSVTELTVRPPELAALLRLLGAGTLSRPVARTVFTRMMETGRPAAQIIVEEGLAGAPDFGAVEAWVETVMRENPPEVERLRAGESRLMGWFIGQVMRRSGGKADPAQIHETLRAKLEE